VLTGGVAILQDNSAHGEDNYLVRTIGAQAFLDAIMDGVTRRGGKQASQWVVDALAAAPLTSAGDLVAMLEQLNLQLYERGGGGLLLTTVVVALFLRGKLSVAGVGDSSAFLIRSGTYQQLYSPKRGVFLGAAAPLQGLFRTEMTIEPGDRLLLATDGITENVTSSELVDIVRHSASPDEAVGRLKAIMATRSAGDRLPAPSGGRFRCDDWTALVRFFGAPRQGARSQPRSDADIEAW
jgi:serine/threonine protein phosphatase PrpC